MISYLTIPATRQDLAEQFGAKFDNQAYRWYVDYPVTPGSPVSIWIEGCDATSTKRSLKSDAAARKKLDRQSKKDAFSINTSHPHLWEPCKPSSNPFAKTVTKKDARKAEKSSIEAKNAETRKEKASAIAQESILRHRQEVMPYESIPSYRTHNIIDPRPVNTKQANPKQSKCEKCELPIIFKKVNGKYHPTNLDGSEHWDLCSETRTKRVKETGVAFYSKQGDGFVVGEKVVYMTQCAGRKAGSEFVSGYTGEAPPW